MINIELFWWCSFMDNEEEINSVVLKGDSTCVP